MIIYDFKCSNDHRFEAMIDSMFSPAPDCMLCGSESRKVPAKVKIGNSASAGASREDMPNSWTGMGNGHPDAIRYWRDKMTKREKLEEKYPELGGDRRPVLAHEGIFRGRPLRAGDDIHSAVGRAMSDARTGANRSAEKGD